MNRQNPFRVLPDVISLIKNDGTRYEDLKANFLPEGVRIPIRNLDVPLEVGDFIERRSAFDKIERYEVLEPGYQPGTFVEPSYLAKVRSEAQADREKRSAVQHIQQFGANSRVNIDSRDYSVNVAHGNTGSVFCELRDALRANVEDISVRNELESRIEELEQCNTKPAFLEKLAAFTKATQDATAVIQPFLPALIEWGSRLAG
jgi:hypothetical protein